MPKWLDDFMGKTPDTQANADAHPVLSAALAADVDTEDKFVALMTAAEAGTQAQATIKTLTTERDTLKAQIASHGHNIQSTREKAKASAAIAFAKDEPARLHALEDIDATADGPAMERLAARMDAAAKAAVPETGQQQQTAQTDNSAVARALDANSTQDTEAQTAVRRAELLSQSSVGREILADENAAKSGKKK